MAAYALRAFDGQGAPHILAKGNQHLLPLPGANDRAARRCAMGGERYPPVMASFVQAWAVMRENQAFWAPQTMPRAAPIASRPSFRSARLLATIRRASRISSVISSYEPSVSKDEAGKVSAVLFMPSSTSRDTRLRRCVECRWQQERSPRDAGALLAPGRRSPPSVAGYRPALQVQRAVRLPQI
jgi:hypothetical protein